MTIDLCLGCMREKKNPGPCPYCGFDESAYRYEPHQLRPGSILNGKYLVGKVIGEGGFGITYLSWDLNLEMKLAIKEYFPNGFVTRNSTQADSVTILTGSKEEFFLKGREKFVGEAKSLAKFWGLPGIVAVKDYFWENGTAYIVMEFVEGKTLKQMMRENGGRLKPEWVFDTMRPVMESMEKVHQAGVIHRDISPDNLIVDSRGNIKLIDFGAARNYFGSDERSMTIMLKPGYAPMEQYQRNGSQGPWTDVYALCATIYAAITGKVPPEVMERLGNDTLKRPSELGVFLPKGQEMALMKGMEIQSAKRYQNIGELKRALYACSYDTESRNQGWNINQNGNRNQSRNADQTGNSSQKGNADQTGNSSQKRNVDQTGNQDHGLQKNPGDKKKRKLPIVAAIVAVVAVAAAAVGLRTVLRQPDHKEVEQETNEIAASAHVTDRKQQESQAFDTERTEDQGQQVVVWTDANMERLIRKGLDRPDGDITKGELAKIKALHIVGNSVTIAEDLSGDSEIAFEDAEDISNGEKINTLEDMKYFTGLEVLELNNQNFSDISELSKLTKLTKLDLCSTNIEDISALADLTNLEHVILASTSVKDLGPLSNLSNLQTLNLYKTNITDISPLSEEKNLTWLRISDNDIADISALSGLENLTYLDLADTGVKDISALSGLVNLTELDLSYTEVKDISALSGLTNLTELNLYGTNVKDDDVDSLKTSEAETYLEEVDSADNTDTESVIWSDRNMERLVRKGLERETGEITKSELANIKILRVVKNSVLITDDISRDEEIVMDKAEEIADDETITSLDDLKYFTGLERLELNYQGFDDIEDLPVLPKLTWLDLGQNSIEDISPLSEFTGLETLNLATTDVNDLTALSNLISLQKLNLYSTKITNIDVLGNLVNLKWLRVTGNDIEDTSVLSKLENLEYLDK